MSPQKSFFSSLFDFSFTSLITPRVLRVLYALILILILLYALLWVYVGFNLGLNISTSAALIVALIVVPIITLLYIIFVRIQYEFIIVVFRILETNTERVRLARQGRAPKLPIPTFDAPAATAASVASVAANLSDDASDWASVIADRSSED